jgi:hypothetical protein
VTKSKTETTTKTASTPAKPGSKLAQLQMMRTHGGIRAEPKEKTKTPRTGRPTVVGKPWEAAGLSKSVWYERKKNGKL